MLTITMFKKDLLPVLRFTLVDRVGNMIDLTNATVRFYMGVDATNLIINGRECTKTKEVDQITGKVCWYVEYVWEPGDTDLVGEYLGEVVLTFPSGKMESANGPFNVVIAESLRLT